MPLETLHGNDVLLLGQEVVWGTCQIGDDLGTVVSCRLRRAGQEQKLENQHGVLLAVVIGGPGFELDLETVFDADVEVPGLMDEITFPYINVGGRIQNAEVMWERGKERMLSIRATHWDSLANAGVFYVAPGLIAGAGTISLKLNNNDPLLLNNNDPLLLNQAA